jgi:hypothetical protein
VFSCGLIAELFSREVALCLVATINDGNVGLNVQVAAGIIDCLDA